MKTAGDTWAIVLAGGDGTRLQSLVRLLHDDSRPKQYATLVGSRSLLQATVERVAAVAPPARTMVVVGGCHQALARRQLADWPAIEVVVQPENRGTAFGLMLPLARLRGRDPDARVAVFPSDHHVPRPEPFIEAAIAALGPSRVTLVGIGPDRADPDLGWIVPDQPGERLARVARFVEKPDRAIARDLLAGGALWNSFVLAGCLSELWGLLDTHLPVETAAFERARTPGAIAELYRHRGSSDLSRAVLEHARDLQVARVDASGWADWGTPQRVLDSLGGTPALDVLLGRIADGLRRGSPLPARAAHRPSNARGPWIASGQASAAPPKEE
jgi:mannose-1-phosphate guanylyltransferase